MYCIYVLLPSTYFSYNKDREYSNKLTRLTPSTGLPFLGFEPLSRFEFWAFPQAGLSQVLLRMGSLGFSSSWVLSASPLAGLSRLLLWLGSLGFSSGWALSASPPHRWVGVPARRSNAKVRSSLMFIRPKLLLLTSCVDLLFIHFS